jgi:hypothetical protein
MNLAMFAARPCAASPPPRWKSYWLRSTSDSHRALQRRDPATGEGVSARAVDVAADHEGKPAAMACSGDADERKKAILSVLREGAPLLIWDNISRGAVIGCPHIERASTTELLRTASWASAKPRARRSRRQP